MSFDAGPQHPQLEAVLHLVEAVLQVAHLGGQAQVAQHQRRVGQAHRRLGHVLHLDQHVDRPVEVGERAVLGRRWRLPPGRGRQLAQPGDARRRAPQEQHVAGQHDLLALDVGDPLAVAADGHDAHAGLHRQLEVGEGAAGEVRAVAHPHPVRHLLGVGQVGHQLAGDAQAVGDDAGDVDRGVGDALDRRDDLQHRRHGVGLPGVAGGHDAHRAHVVDQVVHALLELADLLGHVGIAEVERGVGQVDHQLGEVLGLGQHGPEVAGSVVHRRDRCTTIGERGAAIGSPQRSGQAEASIARRPSGRASGQAEQGDGDDEGERAHQVDRRADHRDAVGVGVDPGAVRRHRAVVGDAPPRRRSPAPRRCSDTATICARPGLASPSSPGHQRGPPRRWPGRRAPPAGTRARCRAGPRGWGCRPAARGRGTASRTAGPTGCRPARRSWTGGRAPAPAGPAGPRTGRTTSPASRPHRR